MFGSIFGLPLHILIVHLVVVVGPLAGFMAIAYAVRPGWRWSLKWPTLVATAVAGVTSLIAGESGEQLEHRLKDRGLGADQLALIHDHTEAGDVAKVLGLLFMVVTLVAIWFFLSAEKRFEAPVHITDPAPSGRQSTSTIQKLAVAAVVLTSIAFIVSVTIAGHLGAVASWKGVF